MYFISFEQKKLGNTNREHRVSEFPLKTFDSCKNQVLFFWYKKVFFPVMKSFSKKISVNAASHLKATKNTCFCYKKKILRINLSSNCYYLIEFALIIIISYTPTPRIAFFRSCVATELIIIFTVRR